jgi:RND superfamily putative drug exporter
MASAQNLIDASISSSPQHGLGRLAGWCYDHRRLVLLGWLLAVVAVIGLAPWAGSRLDNNFALGSSPAQQAQNLLTSRFPAQQGDSADVVLRSSTPLDSPADAAAIGALARSLRPLAHVSGVQSPLARGGSRQLSADRRIGFVVVQFDDAAADLPASSVRRVIGTARSFARPGLQVAVGGAPVETVVSAAPGSSETIGLAAAIAVMLLAFGSVVAMGLPILTALVGVGLGFGLLEALSHLFTVPTFGPDVMVMIGLGVGIDYALLIVTRYRQALAGRQLPRDAVIATLSTAGRAVLFAGGTVVIALLGLFVVGLPFTDGLAAATIVAVALVLAAALTLLPAMLGFAGPAIDRLHIPGLLARPAITGQGFWYRWSRTVQRRPWICAASALAVLVVLAIPLFSMRLAFSDAGNDPASLTTRQAYDLLAEGFGPGFNGPLVIAADLRGPHARASIARLGARLSHVPGVASASPPAVNAARDAAVIIVYPATAPQAAQTAALVGRLRDQVIPQVTAGSGVTAFVGGETAAGADTSAYLSARLPWVIGLVVTLAFLLLVAVFRSLAIPLKAVAMNLLSMGAAYGVIVAVYQWGWLAGLFGVSRTGPIDPWIPLMMFTIVFGLSMDYEVFLLSRMREEWLRNGDNSEAVACGLAGTGRVITAAAAIMVCVFGSFVIGDPLRILDVFGFGLAVAVLVDATVVRMILVPAIMQILGSANWWLPRWLGRAVPNLTIEPSAASRGGPPGAAGRAVPRGRARRRSGRARQTTG